MASEPTAQSLLNRGNAQFVEDDFEGAIFASSDVISLRSYNEAVNLAASGDSELLVECLVARSACNFKRGQFLDSIDDAKKALERNPSFFKAYLRKGMATFALEEYESAKAAFELGLGLAPESQQNQFKTWIRKCDAELAEEEDEDATSPFDNVPRTPANTPVNPSPLDQRSALPFTPSGPPPLEPDVDPKQVPPSSSERLRHEWYQTANTVTVEIFVKKRSKEQVSVDFEERALSVSIKLDSGSEYQLHFDLADSIVPSQSTYSVLGTKVEIRLAKSRSLKWTALEGGATVGMDSVDPQSTPGLNYPSSSRRAAATGRNWDALAKAEGADEEDKLDGDAALNKVFAGIYKNATDEQRMAMQKSFQESGGTVLSTNWEEVGKAPVKGTPVR